MEHSTPEKLTDALENIRSAPINGGELKLIVRRPTEGEREVIQQGDLSTKEGLIGDNWKDRPSRRTADKTPHPDMQLNIMNARVAESVAGEKADWALAGDQLYVDFDLSTENLPHWTKLAIGTAIIQITDQPHTGCAKFTKRFGMAATKWTLSEEGRALNLRGVNAKVIQDGTIRIGDRLTRLDDES